MPSARPRQVWRHVLGITWVIGAAMVVLIPALHHGLSLGPYDILSRSGLTRAPGVTIRNTSSGDQIAEMIPWTSLAWTQVHAGHLPLWNPYNGLGLPLAFNWQSAVFSLPTVISYAFPLHLAFTAQVIMTVVVAGTGAYILGRVLHVGVIGSAMAGTVFELSGSFMGWLGWPHAAVMSWAGWLLASTVLIVRSRRRVRSVVLFAVIVALALYAGQPEIFTMLVGSALVFGVTMVILNARSGGTARRSVRPLADLSIATVAGLALGAPLLLPGLQVLSGSTRNSTALLARTEVGKALPPHDLVHLLAQGYNGLPIAGSHVFGDAVYFDTAAYLGVISVTLAVLGVVRRRRRPEVLAFLVVAVVTLAIVFAPPVEALILHLPVVSTIDWHRDLMMLSLCVAVLAGVGVDALAREWSTRSTRRLVTAMLASFVVLLGTLWVAGSGGLSPQDAGFRRESLLWPLATTAASLLVVVALGTRSAKNLALSSSRRIPVPSVGHVAGGVLLLLETAFLVSAGAPLWSSSAQVLPPSAAVTALTKAVGGSTVGFGISTCFQGPAVSSLGILPEVNSLFGVHQLDFYDPVFPRGYFPAWASVSPSTAGVPIYNSFCPPVTTAVEARRFGVAFVLEPAGQAGPAGAIYDRTVGGEDLYRIPGSGDATLTPAPAGSKLPPLDAPGTPVTVHSPTPSSWKVTTSSGTSQVLRLRLTDEPGWHATIDGQPLKLVPYGQVMMEARVPAGHHVIELRYWPTLLTVGLMVAGLSAVLLLSASAVAWNKRHRRNPGAATPKGGRRLA